MHEAELSGWTARPLPTATVLKGRWCRLERLDLTRHGADVHAFSVAPDASECYRYLPDIPPADRAMSDRWTEQAAAEDDPRFYAVIDRATGHAEGRQSLLRITPEHGVIEIGHILWGPRIARTRVATEALYLFAQYAFDVLGYRRFEWKCNAENEPSRRAAERFGFTFEGVFRQHMVVKGRNRDTAWFAITDADWPAIRAGMERWLDSVNFDKEGAQRQPLREMIAMTRAPSPPVGEGGCGAAG